MKIENPMTMTQKILAAHSGQTFVKPGDLVMANLDLVLGNEITSPVAINEFEKAGFKNIFDRQKVTMVMDHFTPNKDIKAAQQCKQCRTFAKQYDIENFYDTGSMGIEHCLLPERGLVIAGDCVIGADSHTCTYGALGAFSTGVGSTDMAAGMASGKTWFKVPEAIRFELKGKFSKYVSGKDLILHIIGMIGVEGARYQSMEFSGSGVKNLSMDDRFCISNMAIEAGAKNGIFPVDGKTIAYMKKSQAARGKTARRLWKVYEADKGAEYSRTIQIDLGTIKSTVAFPHLPENTKTIDECTSISIDQVVIGSCTNGRLSDMKIAAKILKGKKVHKNVRTIIIPGSQKIYKECIKHGLINIFIDSGCVVSTPTCGPCLGGHMGILAEGERSVATTNRNFVGRMGHVKSEVYLASPAIAAFSALAGKIAGPAK